APSCGQEPAAASALQGAAQPEAGPVRAVPRRAGAFGAAALTLAWHTDHGTGGRVQRPFPGGTRVRVIGAWPARARGHGAAGVFRACAPRPPGAPGVGRASRATTSA